MVPQLSANVWTLFYQAGVVVAIVMGIPLLMTALYHLLREYID
jgi:hypothetical protein